MIKLCVFDFDSTLMDGETIDNLAAAYGVGEKVSEITKQAMEGKLDFFESLTKRVSMLKGMSLDSAINVCENLPLMQGAIECVKELKNRGIKVVCFSGGFSLATSFFAKKLGLSADFSNILHVKNGILSGQVGGDMCFSDSKGVMLLKLQNLLSINREETLVVGDGANDLSMFKYAESKVAFCAKEVLKKEASIIIDKKDLREILTRI